MTLDNVQGSGDFEGFGASGVGGTVFAGFDLPVGERTFVGIEANADKYSADVDAADVAADWGWGISGRAGFKLNPGTALYGRVGYAHGRATNGSFGAWADGVRYGAGLEASVAQNLSVRAELTQFNYEQDVLNNQGAVSLVLGF